MVKGSDGKDIINWSEPTHDYIALLEKKQSSLVEVVKDTFVSRDCIIIPVRVKYKMLDFGAVTKVTKKVVKKILGIAK